MKWLIRLGLAALFAFISSFVPVHALALDVVFTQRNATDSAGVQRLPPHPTTTPGVLLFDITTMQPTWAILGTGLSFDGTNINASGSSGCSTFSCLTGTPTTLSGYGITDAYSSSNPAGYITSAALSPYLTSASAASTYATQASVTSSLATKYNVPTGTTAQYVRGDGSLATLPAPGTGTVTSVALTSSNLTVTGSPVTTTGTLTVTLPNTGTAGTYNTITTDAQGRVTAGTSRTRTLVTKAINTCFQISATRDADVVYNVEILASGTIVGGQHGTIYMETFTDSGCTMGTQEIMRATSGNTNALAVALGNNLTQTLTVTGAINAGEYVKIRTQSNTGTPTFTARPGWERQL